MVAQEPKTIPGGNVQEDEAAALAAEHDDSGPLNLKNAANSVQRWRKFAAPYYSHIALHFASHQVELERDDSQDPWKVHWEVHVYGHKDLVGQEEGHPAENEVVGEAEEDDDELVVADKHSAPPKGENHPVRNEGRDSLDYTLSDMQNAQSKTDCSTKN